MCFGKHRKTELIETAERQRARELLAQLKEYHPKEISALTKIPESTIRNWYSQGRLPERRTFLLLRKTFESLRT